MSKSKISKGKLVRKFGENIFGNPKFDRLLNRKAYSPGQHGQSRRSKLSNYGIQLQEKQKILNDKIKAEKLRLKKIADEERSALNNNVPEHSRVYGYQFELDTNLKRGWSGGIYDQSRKNFFLYPITRNEKGRKIFQPNFIN